MAVILFFCTYYPIGFDENINSGNQSARGFLVFLLLWQYLLFVSTFAHSAITWIELPEMASTLTLFLWMLCILFCGYVVLRCVLDSESRTDCNAEYLYHGPICPAFGRS
jgi:ABC-type multidrug transport system permease subunit